MTVSVPDTEAEVFEKYFPTVKYLVSKAGIRNAYVEDYAMNLMVKFLEKGILQQYDPERTTDFNGTQRTSSFTTYLYGFVNAYLRHFAKRDAILAQRSFYSTDVQVHATKGDSSEGIPLMDYLGITVSDNTDDIEAEELIQRVRDRISNPKLLLFFDMVLLQVEEHGKVDIGELTELFEVTRSSIHNWIKKLRAEFDACR